MNKFLSSKHVCKTAWILLQPFLVILAAVDIKINTHKNPGMQGIPIHHMSSIAVSSANPNKSMKEEDEGIVDHDELLT
jgi:hypothetical protein